MLLCDRLKLTFSDIDLAGDIGYNGSREGVITCYGIVGMVTLATSKLIAGRFQ
jgi:hypothetical protein